MRNLRNQRSVSSFTMVNGLPLFWWRGGLRTSVVFCPFCLGCRNWPHVIRVKYSVWLSHLTGLDILRQSRWLGLELSNRLDGLANYLQGHTPYPRPFPVVRLQARATMLHSFTWFLGSKLRSWANYLPAEHRPHCFWLDTRNRDTWMHQTRTLIPIKKIFRLFQASTSIISLVCLWIWFAKTED